MKTRKILALILAVLMVLGTMPLTLLAVSASGTAITAPTTLPDGQTYIGTEFLLDSFDLLATYQARKGVAGAEDVQNANWIGDNMLGAGASEMACNGAEGIMFKIDATKATVNSDVLDLVIIIQTVFDGKETYLISNPGMPTGYGSVSYPAGATSTWYCSMDGKTWQENTVGEGKSRHTISVGTGEAYVFVPMDAFWTRDGRTYLQTGVAATEKEAAVNWNNAKAYFGNDFTFKMTNYYFGGNFGDGKTLAQDPAVKISEWRIVKHGTAGNNPGALPSKLPTVDGTFYNDEISDGLVVSSSKSSANVWLAQEKLATVSDKTSWIGSAGVLFKFDGRNVAGTEPFNIAIELAVYSENGNTYLLSDPNLAKAHKGVATDTANTSSTWYVCTDGSNWTPLTHKWVSSYAVTAPITAERTMGYVFIPLNQFWSKGLSSDPNLTMQNGADTVAAMTAGGKAATLGDFKIRAEKGANDAAFSISELGFVYMGEDPDANVPEGGSQTPPTKLPDTNDTYKEVPLTGTTSVVLGNTKHVNWPNPAFTTSGAQTLEFANGILFKVENSVASATPTKISFAINAVGKNGVTTYICSNINMAMAYKDTTFEGEKISTWYVSSNGKTWTPVTQKGTATSGTTNDVPVSGAKGTTWVYIPVSSMYTRHGETKLGGGANTATDQTLGFAQATKIVGGWEKFTAIGIWFNNDTTVLSDFKVVTDPTFAPGAESAPSKLPTTGKEYTGDVIDPDFVISGNENSENPWDGYWYAGYKDNKFDLSSVPADWMYSEGFMFKFDTSNAPGGSDLLSMLVEFSVASDKGSTYLLSDPNMVKGYGKTASGDDRRLPTSVVNTATSTWYYSIDGITWQSVTKGIEAGASPTVALTEARTTGYVFIPLDQFWCYGITSNAFSSGEGMSAREALNILGDKTKIGDMKLRLLNNAVSSSAETKISEFRFVKSASYIIGENVTVTNDLNYNLFVSLPTGYTGASMTIQVGEKSLTPKAEYLSGNMMKYTFADITFADIGTQITATFTAKDADGKNQTQTHTTTIAEYLHKLVDKKGGAQVFRDLTISMLHYGAAVQKKSGYSGTLCNNGIEAASSPQSSTSIRFDKYLNPNEAVWGTPELVLDGGSLLIKIKVTAPDGYNMVRYQTEGRTSTTEIKDGYAYIPVCAYETRDLVTMNYHKKGMASHDHTMGISFNYLLKQAASANTEEAAFLDALLTFANEARVYKR